MQGLRSRLLAEFIGSLFLVATIVGSGIMGERLAGGSEAVALLANTVATAAMLFVLICAFAATSGAHFNPVVTLVERLSGRISSSVTLAYIVVQIIAAVCGTWLAHAMFDLPWWQAPSGQVTENSPKETLINSIRWSLRAKRGNPFSLKSTG